MSMWTDNKDMVVEGCNLMKSGVSSTEVAYRLSQKYNLNISKSSFLGARMRAGLAEPAAREYRNRSTQAAIANRPVRVHQFHKPAAPSRNPAVLKSAKDINQRDQEALEAFQATPLPVINRTYLPTIPSIRKCRWIHGDPAVQGAFWCGHATTLGSSWCSYHDRRVYSTVRVRKQHSPVTRVHFLKGRL